MSGFDKMQIKMSLSFGMLCAFLIAVGVSSGACNTGQRAAVDKTLRAISDGAKVYETGLVSAVKAYCAGLARRCYDQGRRSRSTCPELVKCIDVMGAMRAASISILTLAKEATILLGVGKVQEAKDLALKALGRLTALREAYQKLRSDIDRLMNSGVPAPSRTLLKLNRGEPGCCHGS